MITLTPEKFVNELEHAAIFIFSTGFYCGLALGIFIAFYVYIREK